MRKIRFRLGYGLLGRIEDETPDSALGQRCGCHGAETLGFVLGMAYSAVSKTKPQIPHGGSGAVVTVRKIMFRLVYGLLGRIEDETPDSALGQRCGCHGVETLGFVLGMAY